MYELIIPSTKKIKIYDNLRDGMFAGELLAVCGVASELHRDGYPTIFFLADEKEEEEQR